MAHTTRAYIGQAQTNTGYWRMSDGVAYRGKENLQAKAEAEASRILADVEPETATMFTAYDNLQAPIRAWRNSQGMAWEGDLALAESLAAFVNDGGRA